MFWATVIRAEDACHVRSWGASVEAGNVAGAGGAASSEKRAAVLTDEVPMVWRATVSARLRKTASFSMTSELVLTAQK